MRRMFVLDLGVPRRPGRRFGQQALALALHRIQVNHFLSGGANSYGIGTDPVGIGKGNCGATFSWVAFWAWRQPYGQPDDMGSRTTSSISLPSVATLTRSFASFAIIGVKRLSIASVRISWRDTRDRYLARRHPDAEALPRQSARAKPYPYRRARGGRRSRRGRHLAPDHNRR